MKLPEKLATLLDKTTKLAEQHRKLVSKNEMLENELGTLKQTLEKEQREKEELRDKIKIIKLAQNIGTSNNDEAGVAELKRKLNEYIKEIDNCITMLNE